MKWFNNLKIGTKMIAGFIIVTIIAGIVGTIGIVNINKIDQADTALYEENTLGLAYLGKANVEFQKIRLNILYLDTNSVNKNEYVSEIQESFKVLNDKLTEYASTIIFAEDRKLFDEVQTLVAKYKTLSDKVVDLITSNQSEQEISTLIKEMGLTAGTLGSTFDKMYELNVIQAKEKADGNEAAAKQSSIMMIVVIIIAIIMAIGLGIFISRSITVALKDAVGFMQNVGAGDLSQEVPKHYQKRKDEIGGLSVAVAKMSDNLNNVISNIGSASEQVAAGSKQVSDSSIALSQGATEQASSIEELTASLEEISSQTKLNAQNANEANELAETAKLNAVQGNTQMKEMLKAMEEINDSSSNISKIIKVIDEIAFQTNILALNAAVEAARAGQHGKGFAVVAEEVRNLAARSANAAKETTEMIEGSIKKVEGGTQIANETANALNKIVEGVAKAAALVGDIAGASNEQAAGIGQINQGIMQVSQVVQTNSATSEESAAASEELADQAQLLKEQVAKFKLRKAHRSASSYRGLEDINPEVLHMLEQMNDKKKTVEISENYEENVTSSKKNVLGNKKKTVPENEAYAEVAATSPTKIALSDKEFGKY